MLDERESVPESLRFNCSDSVVECAQWFHMDPPSRRSPPASPSDTCREMDALHRASVSNTAIADKPRLDRNTAGGLPENGRIHTASRPEFDPRVRSEADLAQFHKLVEVMHRYAVCEACGQVMDIRDKQSYAHWANTAWDTQDDTAWALTCFAPAVRTG